MPSVLDHPLAFLPLVVLLMFIAGALGAGVKSIRADALSASSESLKTLESAVLGLLGLLLGFSFAMGVSRYDTRKQLELEEANAIGTTWLRTDALASLNDTIDVTEKRTTAFENRIPTAAWVMLLFMACAASALVGSGISPRSRPLLIVLPLVVGAALTLILDLDSPRAGFVRIRQNSMARLAAQIGAPQP